MGKLNKKMKTITDLNPQKESELEKSILILDPATEWLKKLGSYLKKDQRDVTAVTTVGDVKMILQQKKIDVFIVNLFIGDDNSVALIQELKTNNPSAKVIFVLDDDSLIKEGYLKPEDLILIGGSDIFIKPIELGDLLKSIDSENGILGLMNPYGDFDVDEGIEFDRKDENFTRIPLIHFHPGHSVLFNTYVRLGEDRYVKILSKGDSFTKDFLERYVKQKKIVYFYFAIQDRVRYINKCNDILHSLNTLKTNSNTSSLVILDSVVEKYVEEVYTQGISGPLVEMGKSVIENLANTISRKNELKDLLGLLHELDPAQMEHSFLVAFLSNMIASQFDWFTNLTSETLGMACIFHDIGKTRMPLNILHKSVYLMSKEELEAYHNHPIWGAEIVSKNRHLNPTVPHIILQHHECDDGSGFPYGFPGSKLLMLSKIVYFCDLMGHLMAAKKIAPTEALKLLLKDSDTVKKISREILKKFCSICTEEIKID